MRKTKTSLDMDEYCLMAAFVQWCVCKGLAEAVDADERKFIQLESVEVFMNGSIDREIKDYILTQPESFSWDMLSVMRTAKELGNVVFQSKANEREAVCAQQLLTSTFDDLMGKAAGDEARLLKFLDEHQRWATDVALQTDKYKRTLIEGGQNAVGQFMKLNLKFTHHLTFNGKPISREYAESKTRPSRYHETVNNFIADAVAGSMGSIDRSNVFGLHVLDYIVYQSVSKFVFQDSCATVGNMVQASHQSACLTIFPMPFGGCSGSHSIKHRREIEDTLMSHGLDLSMCASVSFADHDIDSDRRCLSNWCSIVVKSVKDNSFRNCLLARGRSGGDSTPLLRTKDMYTYEPSADDLPSSLTRDELQRGTKIVQPIERHRQRGIPATLTFLKDALRGTHKEVPDKSIICVVDWNPSAAADWASAVLDIQISHMTSANTSPLIPQKFVCITFAESGDMACQLEARLANVLYNRWYKGEIALPIVGRVKPTTIPADELPAEPQQPLLKLGYFAKTCDDKFTVGFSSSIGAKFQNDPALLKRWEASLTPPRS